MELVSTIADFSRRDLDLLGKTKPVLLTGTTGPAIIVIHEVYGFYACTRALLPLGAGCGVPCLRAHLVWKSRHQQRREDLAGAYHFLVRIARVHDA